MDGAPTAEGQQRYASRGRDHREHHRGHRDISNSCASDVALEQVAYDGEGYRHARARPTALNNAPCEQAGQRARHGTTHRGYAEQQTGEQDYRLTAVSVGYRAIQ